MAESPFQYQGPLDAGEVHGRDGLVSDLVERVNARRVTALLGPRRYGKTSLLREVAARCAELATVWVDLYEVTSSADVAIRFDDALAGTADPFASVAGRLAAAVSLNLGVVKVELSRPPRQRPDPATNYAALLEVLVGAALRTPTLLVLDEFSSIVSVPGAAGALRTALQHHYRQLGILFAGSHPSMMRTLFSDRSQPFFGQADLVETPPLSPGAVASIVADGFAATGKQSGTAGPAIASFTGGHPQRAMQLADACWRATEPGETCDQARFGAALEEVRASSEEPMERILAGFERGERAVLRAIAHGGNLYGTAADLLELSAGAAGHARQVLLDHGEVALKDGRPAIVDPLLADWLRRRLPI
ncbi:MAG: AAA family ATPase [Acidimicrobiales bacterium]